MIGYDPIVEQMMIVDGQDFAHFFGVSHDQPFPTGTAVTLKIYDRSGGQLGSWPAVGVAAEGALVQINSDDLVGIPDAAEFKVYVGYPDGQDFCWYRGRVWRRD